jgi:hypothetical protein
VVYSPSSLCSSVSRQQSKTPSRSSSPSSGNKCSRSELDENSEGEVDIDVGHTKAQKINKHGGRPKAADYDDVSKDIILKAATNYRILISVEEAFPNSPKELQMVKEAWRIANEDSGSPPIAITPDISKIVSWVSLSVEYDWTFCLDQGTRYPTPRGDQGKDIISGRDFVRI